MSIENVLNWIVRILWGPPIMVIIFVTGLYFSVATKFFQLKNCGLIYREILGKLGFNSGKEGAMTPFQAVATGIGAIVGAGNVAGVAVAISLGGPGAVFWMWVTAFLGMIVKMVEISLGIHYRKKIGDTVYGGPMHFLSEGLGAKWKWLAILYATCLLLGVLMTTTLVQPHTLGVALKAIFGIPPSLSIAVAVLLTGLAIIGGFRRIGRISKILSPIMGLGYIGGALVVILLNAINIPYILGLIFHHAFTFTPAVGGFAGTTVATAIRQGVARGIFSNEAGLGTAALIHSTAQTDHPVRQSLWGPVEVVVDTIICTMTALVILITGQWTSGLTGIELVIAGFECSIGGVGRYIVGFGITTFVLSTMIAYYVCFETAVTKLLGAKAIPVMKVIYFVPALLFATQPVEVVWLFTDVFVGILSIPNLIGLLLLRHVFIKKLLPDFLKNYETGQFRYPANSLS